jgi:DNA replication protein DnaC
MEAEAREQRKIGRLRRASQLPPGKTFETLDLNVVPPALGRKLRELARGEFLEGAVNLLAFGPPGVGKSHAAAALGHALIGQGHAVLFRPAYQLVQELLAAKHDLALPRLLRRLDTAELLILDDIGYVKQSAEEAEVLFTLIAQRYERRSVMITSNLIFSEWERIFRSRWQPPRLSTAWFTTPPSLSSTPLVECLVNGFTARDLLENRFD